MVFVKRRVDPSEIKARINYSVSASPTISLSDPDAKLRVNLTLSVVQAEPGRGTSSLTFCTEGSIFEIAPPDGGGVDVAGRGGFALGNSDNPDRWISLGLLRVHLAHRDYPSPDLRERGFRFASVPSAVGDAGSTAAATTTTLTHELSWERIFRYEDKLTKDNLVPGEKFKVWVNSGLAGCTWWCWGDLQTNLRDKRLHEYHETWHKYGPPRPSDDLPKEGHWVLGEDPDLLEWENITPGRGAVFEIVE